LLAWLHKKPLQQVGKKSVQDFLSIRKAMGLAIPEGQPLYNTQMYAGYRMRRVGK
jgi:L-fuculose-phosphate aldolase